MAVAASGLATSLVATALGIARVHDIEDYCRAHGLCEESEARTRAHDSHAARDVQLLHDVSFGRRRPRYGLEQRGQLRIGPLLVVRRALRLARHLDLSPYAPAPCRSILDAK
jgi:hypothetical protein